jgi:hypothetical protein
LALADTCAQIELGYLSGRYRNFCSILIDFAASILVALGQEYESSVNEGSSTPLQANFTPHSAFPLKGSRSQQFPLNPPFKFRENLDWVLRDSGFLRVGLLLPVRHRMLRRMRWKDSLALTTIVFADTTHDLGTKIGDRGARRPAPGRGISSAQPLCSQLQLRRTYDGLPRVSVIDRASLLTLDRNPQNHSSSSAAASGPVAPFRTVAQPRC